MLISTFTNDLQMARRMKFSVIGLPHYTIWHLYEPSVDDLRHMEEMEQERLAREKEEQERAEQKEPLQSQPQSDDHIVDREAVQGSAEGPIAHPEKDPADSINGATSDQPEVAEKVEQVKQ